MNALSLLSPLQLAPFVEIVLLMTLNQTYLRLACRWSLSFEEDAAPSRTALERLEGCEVAAGTPLRFRRRLPLGPNLPVAVWVRSAPDGVVHFHFAPFGISFLIIALGFTAVSIGMAVSDNKALTLAQLALLGPLPPIAAGGLYAYWVGLARGWLLRTVAFAEDSEP